MIMAGVREKRTKGRPGMKTSLKTIVEKMAKTSNIAEKVIFWVTVNLAFIT